ncbi:MAG: UDP-glucose 4-epimerase GalE [Bacteroidetes bacterium QH_9_64_21]|nr:MAG: UDP-glucose 4-epimerase GalE [Bacteroidetes bacterium QH_9_64_21]
MRVLVTGGAGYIGSTVARQLTETGYDVVVLDNLSQGNRAAVPDAATFVHGDLRDQALVHRTLADHRPDAIMHFASHTLVGESMEEPLLYLDDNVRCGANLMRAAVEHDVDRFILSSTANLFGLPERIPIDEEVEIDPGSPYGESKFILERMLHWLDEIHDLQYAALRYFNAAGAAGPDQGEDHDPETHLIPLVLQVALGQREKIVIFGDDYDTPDGTCVRDYVHVLDLAQAHIRALEALDDGSRVYNLGNGEGYSVREVIDTARRVTGREIPAEVGDPRPGDPAVLIASSEKIREDLGWAPEYGDLDDIIGSAWEWHRRHPHGYETDGHAN